MKPDYVVSTVDREALKRGELKFCITITPPAPPPEPQWKFAKGEEVLYAATHPGDEHDGMACIVVAQIAGFERVDGTKELTYGGVYGLRVAACGCVVSAHEHKLRRVLEAVYLQ